MSNDAGLLPARLAVGASIAAHGAQKAGELFDGPGPPGMAAYLESLGFQPGSRFAGAASTTEIASGARIMSGAGGSPGPALLSTMIVAQPAVHAKNGFFAQKGGIELGVLYAAAALTFAAGGYGRFSVDAALGWGRLRADWVTAVAVAGGVVAGLAVPGQRRPLETARPIAGEVSTRLARSPPAGEDG